MKLSDMLFANAMMGEGGGGGGSSDFSTAQVTVKSNMDINNPLINYLPILQSDPFDPEVEMFISAYPVAPTTNEATVEVVLYKGVVTSGEIVPAPGTTITNVVVTGNIEVADNQYLTISGDGTIDVTVS